MRTMNNKRMSIKITKYSSTYVVVILLFALIPILAACSTDDDEPVTNRSRTYRMGFNNSAPRVELDLILQSLALWTQRADAAIINAEVPWDSLYAGTSAVDYVLRNYKGLADYYRTKNFPIWVYIEPANGFDRAADATQLVKRNKSMVEADVQGHYKRFAFVMDSIINPEHLGLVLETNLIRGLAPTSLYEGIKKAASEAATTIRAYDADVKLSVSVQVEYAWNKLLTDGPFRGIDEDFIDFPFIQELGLSSYPYFGYSQPSDLPSNYYSRLVEGKPIPVFITEGGWTSKTVSTIASNEAKQKAYVIKQSELLDHVKAVAFLQLTFTDVDLSILPPDAPSNLSLFSNIGYVDVNLDPKPALTAWDEVFKRPLKN